MNSDTDSEDNLEESSEEQVSSEHEEEADNSGKGYSIKKWGGGV